MGDDYKLSSIKRRDERHTKDEIKPKPIVGNKKNTKKWCKGVRGREHVPECVCYGKFKHASYLNDWKLLVCKVCKKELDYYTPCFWGKNPQKPPDWVK